MVPPLLGQATAAMELGAVDRAEKYCERAIAVCEKVLGEDAPLTSLALRSLADLHELRGEQKLSAAVRQRVSEALSRFVRRQLGALPEREQLQFLSTEFQPALQESLVFATRHAEHPSIRGSSFEWLANAKGITVEVLSQQSRLLKSVEDSDSRGLVQKLAAARARMARAYVNPASESQEHVEELAVAPDEEEVLMTCKIHLVGTYNW